MKQKVLVQAIALATAMCAHAAHAQEAATAADTQAEHAAKTLDQVVVTAERRTVDVQKTAIAVSVVSGDQLNSKAIVRIEDLANATPAFSLHDTGYTQNLNIRGIGNASASAAVQSGVAIYQDGVYQPQILLGNAFYDIASIEVLRGPQGTLSGANTTGGALYIRTASPEIGDTSGYGQLSAGNYGDHGFQGAISLPAGEHFALRVAANYQDRDSFFNSIGSVPTDAGKLEEKDLRLSGLFENNGFSALLKLERTLRDNGGLAGQAGPTSDSYLFRPGNVLNPGHDFIRDLDYNAPTARYFAGSTATLELKQKFENGTTLRYVGGYGDRKVTVVEDTDATQNPFADIRYANFAHDRQTTHELNLISPDDGTVKWVAGAYWQQARAYQQGVTNVDLALPQDDGTVVLIDSYIFQRANPIKQVAGVFGNLDFQLSDALTAQVGLRYSKSKTTQNSQAGVHAVDSMSIYVPAIDQIVYSEGPTTTDVSTPGRASDDAVTGKVALNWQANDNNMLYAFVARGYKSGGFDGANRFDPETVLSYELGWKTSALDNRVRLQTDVFYNDYENFQFDLYRPDPDGVFASYAVRNIGKAKFKGAEVQLQAFLGESRQFRFDLGAAWVETELPPVSFLDTAAMVAAGYTLTGSPVAIGSNGSGETSWDPYIKTAYNGKGLFAPELTWNVGAEYEFMLANNWSITPRVNYSYIDKQYTGFNYDPVLDVLKAYKLLSAQVTVAAGNGLSFQLYGSNLADKTYRVSNAYDGDYYGAPRQYGVRVRYDF
ncbi:MAG: TonB-dependent receptor [Pseudoxanthomonas sp.]